MYNIRKSFSSKLSLGILIMAIGIFATSLGVLFTQSRSFIRTEALGRASNVLNTTMQHITRNLMIIENATNSYTWMIEQSFKPESLLDYSGRVVRLNPLIDGCSISAEPDMFKQHGRYFSAYTVREPDTVKTVVEEEYEYFQKIWYKTPCELKRGCWVVYTDEADSLKLTLDGMIASYAKPLFGADSTIVGVISTDLSLLRLSRLISEERPYPNSYFAMIDDQGRYIIHPDSTRLFTQTIYTNADPRENSDIIALGHQMTAGKKGHMAVNIDGSPCLVCYQPVPGTNWTMAIICPDSDVLAGYNRLTSIVVPLFIIGLLVIILLCHKAVKHTIRPLTQLLEKTQDIAAGNMEVHIAKSQRTDVIGRLQNSFATMLPALNFHMGSVRYTTEQAQLCNDEQEKATRLVMEAEKQKTRFIQNVSHQIRTPLNIIMGFAQVLSDTNPDMLSDEEMKSITDTMNHNAKLLNRMVLMLFDSSDTGLSQELSAHQQDIVSCNDLANEAISYIKMNYPALHVAFQTDVDDDFCIQTNHMYLMRALRELLYNSAKYSDGQNIRLHVTRNDHVVRFTVEDTGKKISDQETEDIFKFFTKADDLSEGLGLGLPLAKRHAQNLGGKLILDTDYHDGCRFVIEIPY